MGDPPPEGTHMSWGPLLVPVGQQPGTCTLTGVRRVGCGAVEESGRAAQVSHAGVVGVAVHGAGNRAVAALLRRGAGGVTVGRHTAAAAHETCRKH